MTTVLIVDDQPLQRMGYRMLLESSQEVSVVGEAGHGAEAVRKTAELHPDVVLMDIRMPGMDGIEATRRIAEAGGRSRVLVLTTFDLDEYAYSALRAGASGFLLKDALPDELLAGIRAVAVGDAVVAPAMTRRLLAEFGTKLPDPLKKSAAEERMSPLSRREREVLLDIALGMNNSEIAAHLGVSESTVKTHIGRVLAKIGARDRVHAVILAYDAGLVRPAG